ncbi:MAG: hypothetical protein JSS24_05555 [Proteobacteria bacterium]|nr:hypothetical protein [Pseudomonadota bacterium]
MTDRTPLLPTESPQARLARSRAELVELLQPEKDGAHGSGRGSGRRGNGDARGHGEFPRSMTMKLLSRGAGPGGLAVLALALFALSPTRARQLLRYLPVSAIAKIVVARLINVRGAHS